MEWWKLLFYLMAAELADLTTPAHNTHQLAIWLVQCISVARVRPRASQTFYCLIGLLHASTVVRHADVQEQPNPAATLQHHGIQQLQCASLPEVLKQVKERILPTHRLTPVRQGHQTRCQGWPAIPVFAAATGEHCDRPLSLRLLPLPTP